MLEVKYPPRDPSEVAKQAELNKKKFKVVEYLKSVGAEKPQTVEEIEAALNISVRDDVSLVEEMRKNEWIKYFHGAYSYKVRSRERERETRSRSFSLRFSNGVPSFFMWSFTSQRLI